MDEINIITENLKDFPNMRDKLIFRVIKQVIVESSFDELNTIFVLISKSKNLKKSFQSSCFHNSEKRRHILWYLLVKTNLLDLNSLDITINNLFGCATIWEILNMFGNLASKYFNQSIYHEAYEDIILERTKINDERAFILINIGISIFNRLDKNNYTHSIAKQLLTEKIDKLCYFNICCLDQEIELRTQQLKTNYVLIKYYESNENHELLDNVKQNNFYIIRRNNFLKKFIIYFNSPVIFNYIRTHLSKTKTYYFYHLVITYIDNWNITLQNETYIGNLIKILIKNINYGVEIIMKLNKVISKTQFRDYIKDCQNSLQLYVENDHINTNKIIKLINNYKIDLKNHKKLTCLILTKIKNANIHQYHTVSKFLENLHQNIDVLTYEFRNEFLRVLFKIINEKSNNNILKILFKIHDNNKGALINFFSHEHAELTIDKIEFIFEKHKRISNLPQEIKESTEYINSKKGLCLDELTATIIEEPVIIPPKIVLDKFTIYPYLIIKKMNPFNRQHLTIKDVEEFNKDNYDLQLYKKENNY